ncbi:MAG: 3'-5' exonuclease [Tidjanibacter sp.]|nr:3'-5' exonuclease [Tidjanibacter sp.]MBQ5931966.1 3'-5' exonuclease [Tidjanibacter sp.]
MKLNLKNPIIFFDLETTGVDVVNDRIVEISLVKVSPDSDTPEVRTRRIRPVDDNGQTMHIPEEATAVHGITDADVADAPAFRQIAKSLAEYIKGCDLGGFNSNRFDVPMLAEEFLRAGVDIDLKKRKFVDVQTIFHKKEERTLSAAYRFYCGKELEDAHSAEADTLATYEVLKAQLDKYDDLQNDIAFLADYSCHTRTVDYAGRIVYDDKDQEVFSFGKHKGRLVEEVFRKEPSYYDWMMNGDFPLYTKQVITRIKTRMK